jgi:hypothetical protein
MRSFWHILCQKGGVTRREHEMMEGIERMATGRSNDRGCLITGLFVLVLIFPVVGHIILTVMILGDDLNCGEKILWLVAIWALPVVGPLLYLLLGQRRNRVLG